jgi:hypothetical protein
VSQPGRMLPGGFRIEAFDPQDPLAAGNVIDLWLREGALPAAEAERRVAEVLLVATGEGGRVVAVSTTYLRRSDQLQAELWHVRAFVGAAHRKSGIGLQLALASRDTLVERFASGADRRGIGVLFEVENEALKRSYPQAVWPRLEFVFIGETPSGSHIRVHYFPGALAPEPVQGSA